MTDLRSFKPKWVVPPGATISDIAEERGWNQMELAKRLGCSEKHLSQLINGKAKISPEMAVTLQRVLGSTASFWMSLETIYRSELRRLDPLDEDSKEWINQMPYREMSKLGLVEDLRKSKANLHLMLENLLKFFSVGSSNEWRECYASLQASFRRSNEEKADVAAISVWLRMGELEVEKNYRSKPFPKFDRKKFEEALRSIRDLTRLPFNQAVSQMQELLCSAGVKLVLVRPLSGGRVSGVTRWMEDGSPVIQLSLLGKSNDKFWFTFFHEAAHILLHAESKEDRKSIFIEDLRCAHSGDPQEVEADNWAADFLIPSERIHDLKCLKDRDSCEIKRFAESINIHPGIVVGRMQHEKILPYNHHLNHLRNLFTEEVRQQI